MLYLLYRTILYYSVLYITYFTHSIVFAGGARSQGGRTTGSHSGEGEGRERPNTPKVRAVSLVLTCLL